MKISSLLKEKVISFYPVLARITGNINSAIFLQQLIYWWDKREGETLYKTIKEINKETTLSRIQQDLVIKNLVKLDFLSYSLKGVPAKRHFILNVEKIDKTIDEYYMNTSLYETDKLSCMKPTNCVVGNRQTITESTAESTADTSWETSFPPVEKEVFPVSQPKEGEKEIPLLAGDIGLGDEGKYSKGFHKEIVSIFDIFKTVNPAIEGSKMFANKAQRNASSELFKKFGYQKTKEMATLAVNNRNTQFCPIITTPFELLHGWTKLISFIERNGNLIEMSKEEKDAMRLLEECKKYGDDCNEIAWSRFTNIYPAEVAVKYISLF